MTRTGHGVALTLLLGMLGGAGAALADEPEKDVVALKTRFLEAHRAKQHREALWAWDRLRQVAPDEATERLQLLAANAHFALKESEQADALLGEIVEAHPDHIGALYLLARLRARQGNMDAAKELLLLSAQSGHAVLNDLSSPQGRKEFGDLIQEPGFVLRLMQTNHAEPIQTTSLRDPFQQPRMTGEEPRDPTRPPPALTLDEQQLRKRIEGLFEEIRALVEAHDVGALYSRFAELRRLIGEYAGLRTFVKQYLERFERRFDDMREVYLSVKLQVYVDEGNAYLRHMSGAIKDDRFDEALAVFQNLETLVEQLKAEEPRVFHRNAEDLFLRGKRLADLAARYKRCAELVLEVTGIVLPPPNGPEQSKAIVNDRIYGEGDAVLDEVTDEVIDGLDVLRISRSTVVFRYEGLEFTRPLEAR